MRANASNYEAYQSPIYAELIAAFFSGATLRAFSNKIPVSKSIVFPIVGLLVLSAFTFGFLWIYKVTFAYVVIYISLVPKSKLLKFNQFGDYSYGIYICFFCPAKLAFFIPDIFSSAIYWHVFYRHFVVIRLLLALRRKASATSA